MNELVKYGVLALVVIVIAGGWYAKSQYDAEQRGKTEQIVLELAKSNQRIAERRIRDAEFDKNDARVICEQRNFEWVFSDDKSYCRLK